MMKRRRLLITSVLLMLLGGGGAIVNVAVAWALAYWSDQQTWTQETDIQPPPSWPRYLESLAWPTPDTAIARRPSIGVTITEVSGGDTTASWERTAPSNKTWVSLETRQFGIPLRSMQWEMHGVRSGPLGMQMVKDAAAAAGNRTGAFAHVRNGKMIAMPLTPLWPGFAINTIFYAAMLWVVWFVPGMLRCRIRRRRGLCPACAYPIGTSPVCTECGANLPLPLGEGRGEGADDGAQSCAPPHP